MVKFIHICMKLLLQDCGKNKQSPKTTRNFDYVGLQQQHFEHIVYILFRIPFKVKNGHGAAMLLIKKQSFVFFNDNPFSVKRFQVEYQQTQISLSGLEFGKWHRYILDGSVFKGLHQINNINNNILYLVVELILIQLFCIELQISCSCFINTPFTLTLITTVRNLNRTAAQQLR